MPFIPFILGAAVGSTVTYILKDDTSKEMLDETGSKVKDGVSALTGKVTSLFKKKGDDVAEVVEDLAEEEDSVVA